MADRERNATQGSVDVWERRLAKNPTDRDAYAALHVHHRANRNLPALSKLVSDLAARTSDAAASSRAYNEAGEIAERELMDEAKAEELYRKALARDPQNLEASENLQALLERSARWPELIEFLEAQLEALSGGRAEPHVLAVLHYRYGEVLRKHQQRNDDALEQYRRAFELDPTLLRAIYESRMLLLERGDIRAAATLYEKEIAGDPEVARKIALLRELAEQYRNIDELDGAVSALERASALNPSDVALTHALASELVLRSTRVDDRVRALDLDRVGDLLCDIAQSVGPIEGRVFLAAALGHAPWHHRALFELERITDRTQRASLAAHWVNYLTHNPDGDLADERRVMLARAYQQANQHQDAIYALTPAAERGHVEARALLDELRQQAAVAEPSEGAAKLGTEPVHESRGIPEPPSRSAARIKAEPPGQPQSWRKPDSGTAIDPGATVDLSGLQLLEDVEEISATDDESQPIRSPVSLTNDTSAGSHEIPATLVGEESSVVALEAELDDAEETAEPEELARWHEQLATLQRANNAEAALEVAERILRADPLSGDAFAYAERHYRRTRDFASRAKLLVRTAQKDELPLETRSQRIREAISLYESRLNDVDRAVQAYRDLIALAPDNEDAVRSLMRLLERSKRWDNLVAMLEQSLVSQPEAAPKVAILRRLTEIHRRERKDPHAASKTLEMLLDLDPDDRMARVALTDELLGLEKWDAAADWIDRRIRDATSKAEQVPLLRQLGELFEQRLRDTEAAFHVYERLLEVVPNDAAALERMEAIDEASGTHERLLATLQRRIEGATPAQAANVLVRMATIAEADLLDQDRACEFLQRAQQKAPNNAQISTALLNLYERAERFPELLALLRERAGLERQGKARAELYRRIARLLAQLDDPGGAAEAFGKVNEQGDDHEAWTFLAQRARDAQDESALAHALSRLASLETTAPARRAALFERATILPRLGRIGDAVEPLVAILTELDPNDAEARSTLERLCETLQDYRGLSRVLESHVSRAEEPDEQMPLARELAELYTTKLPDEARAIRALTIWSKATPNDPEPLRRLAEHFERKRRYKELLDVLDALTRVEPEPDARAAALERAALLAQTRLKDDAGAFERLSTYARNFDQPLSAALLDVARRVERVAELCDLCEQEQRYDEFFVLLRERITVAEPAAKIELYRRLAAALIEHRSDDDGALAAYEGMLSIADDHEALRFVQSWAIRHDDPERLTQVLARLARSEAGAEEKRDLLYERGRLLLTRLGRPQDAIAAFDEAATVDPTFAPALDELATACELAGDHARLAQTLERQLVHAGSTHEPLEIVKRLADLYEGPAQDDARAVVALARWAELDRKTPEPLRRLRKRQERGEKSPELLRTLDSLAAREVDQGARIEALVAAALLAFRHFGDAAGAFERLAPLVPLADPSADAAMISIARGSDRTGELFDLLERAERYRDLVEQLDRTARDEPEPERAAALLRREARVLHRELRDEDRAEAAYLRLLAIGEDTEALRFMQARALEQGDPHALGDALERLAKLEADPRELRDLLFDHAHLQHTQLQQPAAALPILRRILDELDPEFEPALDELVSAARAAGDDAELAGALERQLRREPDARGRAELAERLAALYGERLRNPASMLSALEIWAREDPSDVTARRKLRHVLSEQRNPARLLGVLDEIAQLSDSPDERTEVARAAALLCADELQDPDQAFERALQLARAEAPGSEELLRKLAWQAGKLTALTEYFADAGRHEDVVELLRQRAERETDPEPRAELLVQAARTLAERIGDEHAAADVYRDVLKAREDAEALAYLKSIAERTDDTSELEQLLRRLSESSVEPDERRTLMLRRAELLAGPLRQPMAAIELLRQVLLELDPRSAAAAGALVEIASSVSDHSGLSLGLETKLALARGPGERHELAMRLAELYEGPLADPDRAANALRTACATDPDDLDSQRRLRVHLERQRVYAELVQTLDVLSRIEVTQAARDAARLAAARCSFEQLDDAHNALLRLSPLIHAAEREAEALADLVCRPELARELAGIYIQRAKQSGNAELARVSWRKVANIHEQWLDEPAEAFEASLRLLGTDPRDRAHLDEVDRLAKKTGGIGRLQQVYSKLAREADSDDERIELHVRLAKILEREAGELAPALQQLMAASRLDPEDGALLDEVERVATGLGSHSDLLWAKAQKARNAKDPAGSIQALLEVAQTADLKLRDREQANATLRRALELTEVAPELHDTVMQVAAELDAARPELGKEDAQRSLVRAHVALAERARAPRRTELVLQAHRWVSEVLHDAAGGFDVLRVGSTEPPIPPPLMEALEASAIKLGRLDALNAHLARVAENADAASKRELLTRRARILEERLTRFDQAALAYERLLELDPHDLTAEARHFACLKQAGRHRELLQALERRLQRSTELERRASLMREIARVWEVDLKNRASAAVVWSEVHALLPHDPEARAAIARLSA